MFGRRNSSNEDEVICVFGLPKKCPFGFTPEKLLENEKLLKYCSFCMKAAYAAKKISDAEVRISIVNTL